MEKGSSSTGKLMFLVVGWATVQVEKVVEEAIVGNRSGGVRSGGGGGPLEVVGRG